MQKIYTGVGSRETPARALTLMGAIARYLADRGWTLRSGGAGGADAAFANGHALAEHEAGERRGALELYLPWDGFQGIREAETGGNLLVQAGAAGAAYAELEAVLDPSHLARLSPAAHKLHARNVHQVLGQYFGPECEASRTVSWKSSLVICWTPGGELKGGTATAIKLARRHHVPVLNLGHDEVLERIWSTGPEDLEAVLMGWGNHDPGIR
jgi:hypothetical protein